MNSMSSINTGLNSSIRTATFVTVNNANFTSPSVSDPGQTSISTTTGVTNWTFNDINTTNSSVRILNNLTGDNASPYAYDASANGTTGFITTVLFVTQNLSSGGLPIITTCSQNVTFATAGTYTISACITPRKIYYNSNQSFSILMGGTPLTLTGAVSYADGPTNTQATFTTGTTTQPFVRVTATYTASVGTVTLALRWRQAALNTDSTIMVTGITIIKN